LLLLPAAPASLTGALAEAEPETFDLSVASDFTGADDAAGTFTEDYAGAFAGAEAGAFAGAEAGAFAGAEAGAFALTEVCAEDGALA